jgi:hypothetical protein
MIINKIHNERSNEWQVFFINLKNSNKIKKEVYNKMINNTNLKTIMMMLFFKILGF